MSLQIIKDGYGQNTSIFIPMSDWDLITEKHKDLKHLVQIEPSKKKKLSELTGILSSETAEALLKHVKESRN